MLTFARFKTPLKGTFFLISKLNFCMKQLNYLALVAIMLLLGWNATAQGVVQGTVTDAQGEALIGVTIRAVDIGKTPQRM